MPYNFPSAPAVDQIYTFSGRSWKWNGEGWQLLTNSISSLLLNEGSFAVTIQPTTLTGNQTQTVQNATGTIALSSNKLSFFAATTSAELAGVISDETGSGALVFGTSPTLTTPTLNGTTFSTTANVTAGTNAQGQGALTSDYNIITTAANNPSGVTLPTATTGRRIIIVNKGANTVNVYPASGAAIDALATNASISLNTDAVMIFNAASTTLWYSSVNTQINPSEFTTGSGAVTLASATASALNLNSGTTGAVTLDSGTTGAVNVGNNANAKTITIGNATGATSIVLNCGTGALDVGANAIARTVTVGNTTGASTLNLRGGTGGVAVSTGTTGTVSITSGTTGAVTFDSGTTGAVNIGNNANAKTITIGNATGATSIVLNCGTGALDIGANAIARTTTVGNTTGASTLNLRGGTGGVAVSTGTTGIVSIDSGTTGAINIGTGANAKTITVGNATGATSVVIDCGTGALNVGSNAIARTITVGNTTGASALNLNAGTGGVTIAGTTTVQAKLSRSGNISSASWTTSGISFDSAASTFTDTSTVAAGTVATRVAVSVNQPTFASTNAITVTNAASFYVAAAPAAGASTTITNSYAAWFNGAIRLDGSILPGVDNTYDLGSATFRWANLYTGDLHLKNDRGDYTLIEEEDALTIRNNKTGKVYNIVVVERRA